MGRLTIASFTPKAAIDREYLKQRAAADLDKRLGAIIGERAKAGAKARGQDHGFHLPIFSSFDVTHELDLTPSAAEQMLRKLFGQEDRAMLAAGAAERDHQVFEAAALVGC